MAIQKHKAAVSFVRTINELMIEEWFDLELKREFIDPILGAVKSNPAYYKRGIDIKNIQSYDTHLCGGLFRPSKERGLVVNTIEYIENMGGWIRVKDVSYANCFMRYLYHKGRCEYCKKYPHLRNSGSDFIIPKMLGYDENVFII